MHICIADFRSSDECTNQKMKISQNPITRLLLTFCTWLTPTLKLCVFLSTLLPEEVSATRTHLFLNNGPFGWVMLTTGEAMREAGGGVSVGNLCTFHSVLL